MTSTVAPAAGARRTRTTEDRSRSLGLWLQHAATTFWGQAVFFMLVAAVARLYILFAAHGMMDADEAAVGILAQRLLHGQLATYVGPAYMGTWETFFDAPLIALLGPTAWPLHLFTMSESLLLVPLLGAVAGRIYGLRARIFAMLFAAIPPHYVAVSELRALGGYVETMVIGSGMLLLALMIAQRWREGRPTLAQWVIFGFLTGLALWIHVVIIYYPIAIAIWLAPLAFARARRGWSDKANLIRGTVVTVVLAGITFIIGVMPAIVYGLRHNWSNLHFVLDHPAWLDQVGILHGAIAKYLIEGVIPRMVGVQFFWNMRGGPIVVFGLGAIAGIFTLAASIWAIARFVPSLSGLRQSSRWQAISRRLSDHWPELLPILLIAVVIWIFWRSPNVHISLAIKHPYKDEAGRYALALAIGMTLIMAGFFAALPAIITRIRQRFSRAEHIADSTRRIIVPVLLGLLLVAYAAPYIGSDNVDALQSPTTVDMTFPAEHTEVLAYLEEHNIHYAWANLWISQVVLYMTDGRVKAASWEFLQGTASRFPDVQAAVAKADRPSFIVQSDPAQGLPAIAKAMDALGVTYTTAHFGPIWVITPLSRTVTLSEMAPAIIGRPAPPGTP